MSEPATDRDVADSMLLTILLALILGVVIWLHIEKLRAGLRAIQPCQVVK